MESSSLKVFKSLQKPLWQLYQILYFLEMFCILLTTYHSITMFRGLYSIVPYTNVIESLGDLLLPFVIVFNLFFMLSSQFDLVDDRFKWNFTEGLIAILVCGSLFAVYYINKQYTEPLWFAVLILGAHNIDYKKILKFYFWVSVIFCAITFFCGITGIIENLIYYRGSGERRIAFGFTYPTDCCSHLFFLCVTWTFIRNKMITYVEAVVFALISIFSFVFCNARTSFVTLMLLSLWIIWTKIKPKMQKKDEYYMSKFFRVMCYLSGAFTTGTILILSIFYNSDSIFYTFINRLLSDRIRLSHIGLDKYKITLFGQSVKMNGNGGSTQVVKDYFFLDSSYINTILRYGIITLIIILNVFAFLMLREKNKKNYMLIGVLFIVIIQCTIEHHIMEIGHNPLLLLLFTSENSLGDSSNIKRMEQYGKRKKRQTIPS